MPSQSIEHALQACLTEAVKANTAPHWAGCIVTREGISPIALAGVSDVKTEQRLSGDALYWLASASKLIISLAILRVVEKGEKGLKWETAFDDPDALTAILPELKLGSDHWFMHIFEGWESEEKGSKPKLRKATKAVTLRHLLTWTAASRGQLFDVNMAKLREVGKSGQPVLQDVMSGHDSTLCEPRYGEADASDAYGYGSSANDWLGVFLSRVTGLSQREAVQQLICKPLDIAEDDMNHYLSPARRARKLAIHANVPDVGWTAVPVEPGTTDWSEGPPAGFHEFGNAGIYATLPAYAKVLQAVLTHNEKLLSKEHWDYVLQDDLKRRGSKVKLPDVLWTSEAAPQATATCKFDNPDLGTSLVQALVERSPTKEGFQPGTLHWYGLSNVAWWVDQESGLAGLVGTQTLPFWNDGATKTFQDFQRTAYDQLKTK